jgi:hypothetical protein
MGVKVAVMPSVDTAIVPGIGKDVHGDGYTVKSDVVTVSGSTGLLNCNWITLFVGTPLAPFAGPTAVTEGKLGSPTAPVLNVGLPLTVTGFPATSVAWEVMAIV